MFSFVLRHPLLLQNTAPVVFIQYLAALAVAEGVQTYDADTNRPSSSSSSSRSSSAPRGYRNVPIKLKWPNDIYALDPAKGAAANPADRNSYVKIGGILVNSSYSGGDYNLIVGIGLNTSNSAPTTSLNAVLHALNDRNQAAGARSGLSPKSLTPFTLEKLLARILVSFSSIYSTFCRQGFKGELEEMYYRHWLHGEQVVTLEMEDGARARIKGITNDWGMLLAEELVADGRGVERETGRKWALQTDSNSFDFFKGLLKRKV